MTVDGRRVSVHVRTRVGYILPIQLPVSGYLPTGHFRYMPAGGDRHDGIEPPALDASINGERSRGILNTVSPFR